MPTIKRHNFPGFYSQILDQSFTTTNTARFRPGLIGVASKGPFNIPTRVRTIQDFVRLFGQPVDGSYLGTALGIVAPYTDGSTVVRVGRQYQSLPYSGTLSSDSTTSVTWGTLGGSKFVTQGAPFLSVGNYVQITQPGAFSTVDACVNDVIQASNGTIGISSTLKDTYTNGVVKFSTASGAASKSQSALHGRYYDAVTGVTGVTGIKGNYFFTVTNKDNITVGSLYMISQDSKATTYEIYVTKVNALVNGSYIIEIQTTDDTARGYQALPLQDSYGTGTGGTATLSKATGTQRMALIYAMTEGKWADTTGSNPTLGLQVTVEPGTAPGTKKLNIFSDSALVEVYDSLPSTLADCAETINKTTPSNYITIEMSGSVVPANTVNPWDTSITPSISAINTGSPSSTDAASGGSFADGANGEGALAADYVGKLNPIDDTMTGIKAFEDTDNVDVTFLCAPGITSADSTMRPVFAQLRDTAKEAKAHAIIDIPQYTAGGLGLNLWNAIDWSNGDGQFKANGKFDSAYLSCYFNWLQMNDPITQASIWAPPTIGVLRVAAYTWLHDQPWYAYCGDKRGVIDEATGVAFPHISTAAKESATAMDQGNCVNIILQQSGQIKLMGEMTMQRQASKLTAVHNLVLAEYIVKGLGVIGRRYVFDPNDQTLLTSLSTDMTQFMDGVKTLRGVETYKLVCDTSNNTADTRNNREVIIDLSFIPVDAAERIYLNASVYSSGADLNSITM